MSKQEIKEIVCIICPASCTLRVLLTLGKVAKVEGARCSRGVEYAEQEATAPMRIVMSVIRVKNGSLPTVSVKTDRPIPKECIPKVMNALASIEIEAPVEIGQVVLKDICGANIVTTRKVKRIA